MYVYMCTSLSIYMCMYSYIYAVILPMNSYCLLIDFRLIAYAHAMGQARAHDPPACSAGIGYAINKHYNMQYTHMR